MDILKTYVHTPELKKTATLQMTLDNDYNISETKPDIERLIQEKGCINIRDLYVMKDRCRIRGDLEFGALYMGMGETSQLFSVEGKIPFEEYVNMDGVQEQDSVQIRWDMEDLRISVINSRKLSIRSIIVFHLKGVRLDAVEAALSMENTADFWTQNKTISCTTCTLRKKDQIRIKEELRIPTNRPNILEILWYQENMENIETKLQDGKIVIHGQISLFILYRDEMNENIVNDIESTVMIHESIELSEITPEMIPDIKIVMQEMLLEIKEDSDGEARIIAVEAVLSADINIYQEENIGLLADIYSPIKNLIPEVKEISVDNLYMKNQSTCALREKIHLNCEEHRMLQICHAKASVKLDQMEIKENGIHVEGVVYLGILYISSDDRKPVNATKTTLPFSYFIEITSISKVDDYDIYPTLSQLTATMIDSDEIEVKLRISLDTLIFKSISTHILTGVREEILDFDQLEQLPGITAHMVQEGDTLWSLAKKYGASPKDIQEINDLSSDDLTKGIPLIIMKNMEIFK